MEILPVSELGLALHKFVSKDDKLAFIECVQENLDDTQVHLAAITFFKTLVGYCKAPVF